MQSYRKALNVIKNYLGFPSSVEQFAAKRDVVA